VSLFFSAICSLWYFGNCLLGFGVGGVYGRTPVGQQTHMHPRRPRLVIAMLCLLYEIWGVKLNLTWGV
jgi:hypothetical protein